MKKLIFSGLSLAFAYSAHAGYSKDHTFMCKVTGFDKKTVKGQCDPSKPKDHMKIPREWLSPEDKVTMNAKVKFILSDKQFDQWLAMNKSPMAPKGKAKK